jgi:RecA/RadA recombinase
MATKKPKREPLFNFDQLLDQGERDAKVTSINITISSTTADCISTGSLCMDLLMGGGLHPGRWFTYLGKEQSGKSTLLYNAIKSAVKKKVRVALFDYEGSLDPTYFSRIIGYDYAELFGDRDEKTGKWRKLPKVRYYRPESGEKGLMLLKKVLASLPAKVVVNSKWYYEYPSTKDNLTKFKGAFSTKLRDLTGKLYIPVPDNKGTPELFVGIDSYPAMTPAALVEDDSDAMAIQARMFAKHVNNIKSLVAQKGAVVLGVNQLRDKPGVSFGSPEYEPSGNALKFASDLRMRFTSVVSPTGAGRVEREDQDEYTYLKLKTYKSKVFIPFRESMVRLWIGHAGDSGFGLDPVWDTFKYLQMTGQLRGKKGEFIVKLDAAKKYKKSFTWTSFRKEILSKTGKGSLRSLCFKQIRTGKGIKLYVKQSADNPIN